MAVTLADLRRFAVTRSLFTPTTLGRAIEKFGFVQADPIRAPARAQDLILRHRVKNYRAGGLERRYERLGISEDIFINYGYVTKGLQSLMHPRPAPCDNQAKLILEFLRAKGPVHPRDVNLHFLQGKVSNYFGGSSNATTQLMNVMHSNGLLRVARREGGIRVYAAHDHGRGPGNETERREWIDRLADIAVNIYAPLTAAGLTFLLSRLRYAVPQWRAELSGVKQRAKQRLSRARVDGVDWYWPAGEALKRRAPREEALLLAPFDLIVWDRPRFEILWGWPYRFEAYVPAPKRLRGYYSLPLLWRDQVIGWGNLSVRNGKLEAETGYVAAAPRDQSFAAALEAELDRFRAFLSVK